MVAPPCECDRDASDGFSLLETLVALSVLAALVLSVVQLTIYTSHATRVARQLTLGSALVADKMEQLRALAWASRDGVPVSDVQADLTTAPERAAGGAGLAVSPPGALDRNTAGYCDFLDARGRVVGGGESPPPDAAFVRRWAVLPLAAAPMDGLVLQVTVLPRAPAAREAVQGAGVTATTVRMRLSQ